MACAVYSCIFLHISAGQAISAGQVVIEEYGTLHLYAAESEWISGPFLGFSPGIASGRTLLASCQAGASTGTAPAGLFQS